MGKPIRFGTFCSGIGAPELAWSHLGWTPQWFSEIEPFPCAVLAHHHPDVPNLGDMETIDGAKLRGTVDVVCAGTPCQSFSVAGLRGGMADPRGNLALVFLRLVDQIRPRWVVWENVPGVLSSGGGRDFGSFLGGLAELGYGWAYRVLDAQHFGIPQRRRRVFVVGRAGDWRGAAAVLFERHGLCGHPAPRRETGAGVAAGVAGCLNSGGGNGGFRTEPGEHVVGCLTPGAHPGGYNGQDAYTGHLLAHSLRAKHNLAHRPDVDTLISHSLRAEGFDASEDGTGRGTPLVPVAVSEISGALHTALDTANGNGNDERLVMVPVGFTNRGISTGDVTETARAGCHGALPMVAFGSPVDTTGYQGDTVVGEADVWPCLPSQSGNNGGGGGALLQERMAVRRLTPRECERLQGFPDDFTAIPFRGKPAAGGPRYRALGNSMAVPVLAWIGRRIQAVEAIAREAVPA